ncbi:HAD-IIA family hydrolase [Caminibacter mediatlanticus]|uniref:HAD-superfamily hydrolase, subfamily IIA n=1 Tax=Caminibacter mediatlanticus TB-2 TaxID=391592 RepID=A0AAI9F2S2_9BACT|nr:HAD-IIA family hydrolase [Caminibacter mediatlanticus]EDM24109.1 HAD-superfamily hydrolase, subfamily IIA [Caminibacter mediatlanticus TB-2]
MQGFFVDIQGTLIDDKNKKPLPGAVEFLEYLNEKKIPFILLTNNTKYPSHEFKSYLKSLGFKFKNYLDPLMVLDEVIDGKIAPFGNENFLKIMQKYEIDYKKPKKIIVGLKIYSPDELANIIELILNESEYIGMHKTSLYHKNNKRYPGLGAVLEMLKFATGKEYDVVGKPSLRFFNKAKEILGLDFDKISIISDDLYGDILPAKNLGVRGILVLSGKIKNENEVTKKPDEIYKNIGEFLKYLKMEK